MKFSKLAWIKRTHGHKFDGSSFRVLVVLFNHSDENGENAYPSIATIADEAGVTERSVNRALKFLKDNGWIRQVSRGSGYSGKASVYALVADAPSIPDKTVVYGTDAEESIHDKTVGYAAPIPDKTVGYIPDKTVVLTDPSNRSYISDPYKHDSSAETGVQTPDPSLRTSGPPLVLAEVNTEALGLYPSASVAAADESEPAAVEDYGSDDPFYLPPDIAAEYALERAEHEAVVNMFLAERKSRFTDYTGPVDPFAIKEA